jgi:GGDEF domain-containing protein
VAEADARFQVLQAKLAKGAVPVSVTFGVAEWRPGEDTDALLARADSALYAVRRTARGGEGARETPSDGDEAAAVTAHGLLNSSAVVAMGITTLQAHWDSMPTAERLHLLQRMLSHASFVDERLKSLTQGRLSLVASSPSST